MIHCECFDGPRDFNHLAFCPAREARRCCLASGFPPYSHAIACIVARASANVRTRCPARSPGGTTAIGTLPRAGAQCGLDEGHDGEHTVLISSGAPWFPRGAPWELQP